MRTKKIKKNCLICIEIVHILLISWFSWKKIFDCFFHEKEDTAKRKWKYTKYNLQNIFCNTLSYEITYCSAANDGSDVVKPLSLSLSPTPASILWKQTYLPKRNRTDRKSYQKVRSSAGITVGDSMLNSKWKVTSAYTIYMQISYMQISYMHMHISDLCIYAYMHTSCGN